MKTLELFSGTKSFSKVAKARGHETWTVDINPDFQPDHVGDMLHTHTQELIKQKVLDADVVWMSPVCTWWSLAAGNTYWDEFRMPRSQECYTAIKMMMFCRYIADLCVKHRKIFFIENPNGRCVWILDNKYLHRVWYCRYGHKNAKPTNIYHNLKGWLPKTCFNGNKDCHHQPAKRGSKTGTQGLKGAKERGVIPPQLFEEIFDVIDRNN
jgi:hypothetical protein